MLTYPLIRGARPSFADIDMRIVNLDGGTIPQRLVDFFSIDYDDQMDARLEYLSGAYPVAMTRGQYRASGSIEWGLEAFRTLATHLTATGVGGFGDVLFDIQLHYALTGNSSINTDVLRNVRIVGTGQRNSSGGKDLTTRTKLLIPFIEWGASGQVLTRSLPTATAT